PEVIRMMEDAGVDGFYIDLVRGSQGGGYIEKMIFESEITTFTTEQQVAINNYMRSYLEGADGTQAADALDMLAMVNTDIQLPMEIDLLRRESDFAGAGILLGNCNLPTEGWCSVKSHLLDAESNELSYCDMDPLHIAELEVIADDPENSGTAPARAALEIITPELLFEEEIAYPLGMPRSIIASNASREKDYLAIYPNPANRLAYATLSLPEDVEGAALSLMDAQGKTVWQTHIKGSIVEVPTANWESGMYVCTLSVGGLTVESVQLIVRN
ncbi:MAG: T9SS type A sorting domain-containing protein, partial [Flavobacteriales bacterium]